MASKQLQGLQAPDGSFYVTITDGSGNLLNTRTVLTQSTNFYVNASTGNDSNNGLTPSTAWRNLQRSYDILTLNYDFGGLTHTVNVADGSYTFLNLFTNWSGGGNLQYIGNTSTPANVIIDSGANPAAVFILAALSGNLSFSGFKFTSTSGVGVLNQAAAKVTLGSFDCGTCGLYHIDVAEFGEIVISTGYNISGNASTHVKVGEFALFTSLNSITVSSSGSPTISHFVDAINNGVVNWNNTTFSGTWPNVTLAYYAQTNSSIVASNTVNAVTGQSFPGTLTGITQTKSSYIIGANNDVCTVANLPPTFGILNGLRNFVTDSTVGLAAGIGNAPVGGGAIGVPVYTDNAGVWRIG